MHNRWLLGFVAASFACGQANTEGSSTKADASVAPTEDGGSLFVPADASEAEAESLTLRVDPPSLTLTAKGTVGNVVGGGNFSAVLSNGKPAPGVNWSLDDASLGAISSAGVFAAGASAGSTKVRARVGNLEATADVTVKLEIEEDVSSGLSAADKAKLRAGGGSDPSFGWLYPYDKTVFPRGLLPPVFQFRGSVPNAYYVKVTSNLLFVEAFFPGSGSAARISVSEAFWKTMTHGAKGGDPLTVEVTKIEGGNVTGPAKETWTIAQGSLKGTVYYNTYNSTLAGTGGVLRIRPGKQADVLLRDTIPPGADGGKKECVVCHSVSANGSALVTGVAYSDPEGSPEDSAWYSLNDTGMATKYYSAEGKKYTFGALSPDGSWLVGQGVSGAMQNPRGVRGDFPSRVYDAKTGEPISDNYFTGTARYASTPAFSPDGKWLAYNDLADSDGHTLSLLSAVLTQSPPTFSNAQTLLKNMNKVLGWPSFSPDATFVMYHEGDSFDTSGWTNTATLDARYADLKWVDVATKTSGPLRALSGLSPADACALPYGDAEDCHMNYEPTMLPAAVGGYYWVVFTSRRAYGNTIFDGPGSVTPAGDPKFDNPGVTQKGYRKKLWVSAIDIGGAPGTDISHPAFYLEGQEILAGNQRGFWALNACHADGATCETGDECCGGFCRDVAVDGGTTRQCVPPPSGCANDSEKCVNVADCCGASSGTKCINGFCAVPTPEIR